MSVLSRTDIMRVAAAVGATVVLTLICAACTAVTQNLEVGDRPAVITKASLGNVEMMALPGTGKTVPMPPAWMRKQIELRMAQGRAPGFVEVSSSRLAKACTARQELLGCMINLQGIKVTYIRSGLSAETRHMVLVHEFAHDLYNWRH